uniref:Uncharacterized protein n=1 Tax=Nelumbo nucifera TaxID=4432 RepID=A0A822YM17_NELNU|nr:TPA_asm: hypothetical protein HUJ06_010797 [Nelumbo nucifera]
MKKMNFPKRYIIVFLTFICTSVAAHAIGINQSSKGTILSTFYYGYACSQVPGGWAAHKIGGRSVLLPSFLLWSSKTLLAKAIAGKTLLPKRCYCCS